MDTGIQVIEYLPSLEKLCDLQRRIALVHPFLSKLFPVVLVDGKEFILYDYDAGNQAYRFIKKTPVPTRIPEGVRAAMPLSFLANRMACVITADAFDSIEGHILIFHEFIHCQQGETIEKDLKRTLGIYKEARTRKDDHWELDYPFPYSDQQFIQLYLSFLKEIEGGNAEMTRLIRRQLQARLKKSEFEYMVWLEWKEGLARYIENLIRINLGIPENHYGAEEPFNRIVFYEGGSRYIRFLLQRNPEKQADLDWLFKALYYVI